MAPGLRGLSQVIELKPIEKDKRSIGVPVAQTDGAVMSQSAIRVDSYL